MLPSAKEIELIVTALLDPTFLLSKVDPTIWPKVSEPTKPIKVNVVEAVIPPSYALFAVDAVAVNAFLDISAVVDDWFVTL